MFNHFFPFTTDFERRSIQAAAEVQSMTSCPVSFHPGRHKDAPAEIIRIYQEAGGNVSKAVMSHLDRKFELNLYVFDMCYSILIYF